VKGKTRKMKTQKLTGGGTPQPNDVTPQKKYQAWQQDEVATVVEILEVVAKGQIQILTKWIKEKERHSSIARS